MPTTTDIDNIQDQKIRIGNIMKTVAINTLTKPEILVIIEHFLRAILNPEIAKKDKQSIEYVLQINIEKLTKDINTIIKHQIPQNDTFLHSVYTWVEHAQLQIAQLSPQHTNPAHVAHMPLPGPLNNIAQYLESIKKEINKNLQSN